MIEDIQDKIKVDLRKREEMTIEEIIRSIEASIKDCEDHLEEVMLKHPLMQQRGKLLEALKILREGPAKPQLVVVESKQEVKVKRAKKQKRQKNRSVHGEMIRVLQKHGNMPRKELIAALGNNSSSYRALKRLLEKGEIVEHNRELSLPSAKRVA